MEPPAPRRRPWTCAAAASAAALLAVAMLGPTPLGRRNAGAAAFGDAVVAAAGLRGQDHRRPEPAALRRLVDWSIANPLPPWLSNIEEGSGRGVALVLGQSLRPNGTAAQVLLDRAVMAKQLLDDGFVSKVIVSGGDPEGVGRTEASQIAQVLIDAGIPSEAIIRESQALTTAENIWFSMRWIPKGTGQLFLVTSDFHMPRAMYICKETLNFFYKTFEEAYRDDPAWNSTTKRYPRLSLQAVSSRSFCGSDAELSRDGTAGADVSTLSLAARARDEFNFLESKEVSNSLFGSPLSPLQYIWARQINVTADEENEANFHEAISGAFVVAKALCICKAPPEGVGPELKYPLTFPLASTRGDLPANMTSAEFVKCQR